jgi:hypothetical protein
MELFNSDPWLALVVLLIGIFVLGPLLADMTRPRE